MVIPKEFSFANTKRIQFWYTESWHYLKEAYYLLWTEILCDVFVPLCSINLYKEITILQFFTVIYAYNTNFGTVFSRSFLGNISVGWNDYILHPNYSFKKKNNIVLFFFSFILFLIQILWCSSQYLLPTSPALFMKCDFTKKKKKQKKKNFPDRSLFLSC